MAGAPVQLREVLGDKDSSWFKGGLDLHDESKSTIFLTTPFVGTSGNGNASKPVLFLKLFSGSLSPTEWRRGSFTRPTQFSMFRPHFPLCPNIYTYLSPPQWKHLEGRALGQFSSPYQGLETGLLYNTYILLYLLKKWIYSFLNMNIFIFPKEKANSAFHFFSWPNCRNGPSLLQFWLVSEGRKGI